MICKNCYAEVRLSENECAICGRAITERDKDQFFAESDAEHFRNRQERRPAQPINEP